MTISVVQRESNKWVMVVFKNGQSKICKICSPQILLGPFLKTLAQKYKKISVTIYLELRIIDCDCLWYQNQEQ